MFKNEPPRAIKAKRKDHKVVHLQNTKRPECEAALTARRREVLGRFFKRPSLVAPLLPYVEQATDDDDVDGDLDLPTGP